jgi:hypothetical protein
MFSLPAGCRIVGLAFKEYEKERLSIFLRLVCRAEPIQWFEAGGKVLRVSKGAFQAALGKWRTPLRVSRSSAVSGLRNSGVETCPVKGSNRGQL